MLYSAMTFLIIALVSGVFGFGGIAVVSVELAQILFYVFFFSFLISFVMHFARSMDQRIKLKL